MSSEAAQISERERDILRLVALGATNQQIANQLNISINTVKVHLRNIFDKIGATSRTEATVYAIRQGLVQIDTPPAIAEIASPAVAAAPPALPDATPTPAAETPAAPPLAEADVGARPRPRLMLPIALGAVVLLGLAVVYLLTQRPAPQTIAPTAATEAPAINRWKSHRTWPQPRSEFAIAAFDSKLYLIGGTLGGAPSDIVERYDPSKDQLVALNSKPTPASQVQAVTIGGKLYIPGGEGQGGKVLDVCEAYDPRTKQWETLPPLPAPRSRYALADFEGQLYLFGGWDGASYRGEVFVFDPREKQWSERPAMRTPRANAGAALVEEQIYVIGGENQSGPLTTNERFDPTADGGAWEAVVPLSAPVAAPAVVGTVNSVLLFDPQKRTATEYSPSADAWRTAVGVPDGIGISSRAAALSTSIFLFGADASQQAGAVSEYQVTYSTLFPIINTGQ